MAITKIINKIKNAFNILSRIKNFIRNSIILAMVTIPIVFIIFTISVVNTVLVALPFILIALLVMLSFMKN